MRGIGNLGKVGTQPGGRLSPWGWLALALLLALAGTTPVWAQSGDAAAAETSVAPTEAPDDDEFSDIRPMPDPNLIEADTPEGEAPVPEHSGIEEITVTAQKRSGDLQEVPSAISAFTGADLFDRGVYDVEALATQVPNFQYGEALGGVARITIRGVGNQGFNDPSTAFYIDGIYQNNPTAASALTFYDAAMVEVLRGPQGSLWGRNSTAGAINLSTRPPIHEIEAFGDIEAGAYNQVFAQGVVNVPLWQDRIAARVAGYVNKRDGYQRNIYYEGTWADYNDADNWGIRPQLLFDISDSLSVVMRGGYNHQGGVGFGNRNIEPYPETYLFSTNYECPDPVPPNLEPPYCDVPIPPPVPPAFRVGDTELWVDPYNSEVSPEYGPVRPNPTDPREVRKDHVGSQNVKTWDVNGTLSWDLPELPVLGDTYFTVVGSYKVENRTQSFDADNTEQDMVVANVTAGTTDRVIDAHWRSSGESSTEWLLGFFFLDADGELSVGLPGAGERSRVYTGPGAYICTLDPQRSDPSWPSLFPCGTVEFPISQPFDIQLEGAFFGGSNEALGLAGYGQVTQKFFDDQLRVSLGLRYSWDRKTNYRVGGRVGIFTYPPALVIIDDGCAQPAYESTITAEWDSPTGDFKIEYLPTDENMVYGSISYGWKPGVPGGLSVSTDCLADPILTPNAKPEGVWAYEVGSKNRFFDNRVQANLTGFYYVYANLQVLTQSNNTTFTDNAAEARIWGIEFEGIWMPIDDLTFSIVYGFLDAKYKKYVGWNYATGEIDNFSGNEMIRAPRNQATIAAEYLWSLGRFGYLVPRIQYLVSDEIYFSASNREEDLEPSFSNLQMRLRWQSEENDLFVEGFVENITDEAVRSTRSIGSALFGRPVQGSFQPPRTWGIRIGASY